MIADIIHANSRILRRQNMKRFFFLTTMILLVAGAIFADIVRPNNTPKDSSAKSIETGMTIRLDHDAKEARLIIPKSRIKELRAELEKLDDGSDNTAAVTATRGISRTQTIASGVFLSLALVFGGIWFMRSGKAATRTGKTFIILALVAAVGSAATFVYANAGPPSEARSITGKMFTQAVHMYGTGWGTVKLEAGDKEQIELIVPDPKTSASPNNDE